MILCIFFRVGTRSDITNGKKNRLPTPTDPIPRQSSQIRSNRCSQSLTARLEALLSTKEGAFDPKPNEGDDHQLETVVSARVVQNGLVTCWTLEFGRRATVGTITTLASNDC